MSITLEDIMAKHVPVERKGIVQITVPSITLMETLDAQGNKQSGPLYPMASSIANLYNSSVYKKTTENGKTTFEFKDNDTLAQYLSSPYGSGTLREAIEASGGIITHL